MLEEIQQLKSDLSTLTNAPVTIVAATKTQPIDKIALLAQSNYGICDIGENRAQELVAKYDSTLPLRWHFIGRLQLNKVKYLVDKVYMFQSVDSIPLAEEINRRCARINKVVFALVQLNTGESQKGGVSENNVEELCLAVSQMSNIKLRGLMAVLPKGATDEQFETVNTVFRKLQGKFGESFDTLSMGMTHDYRTAVKRGANMIRIGEYIFGKRTNYEQID